MAGWGSGRGKGGKWGRLGFSRGVPELSVSSEKLGGQAEGWENSKGNCNSGVCGLPSLQQGDGAVRPGESIHPGAMANGVVRT